MARGDKLTPRQREIYEFLRGKIIDRGYGPTVREIGNEFGIKSPNGVMCHLKALEKKGLITREEKMSRAIELSHKPRAKTELPFVGQIAAGNPVLAEEDLETMDFADLFDGDDKMCLKVKGDSMIDAHITEGDYVVIRRQQTCRDGDIVVAAVDGTEATLKTFYREKDRIRLQPENSEMEPIYARDVQVVGVLESVIRRV
ncbi:transcriptional repressor LexA [Alienimonas chondri]|uniref:LexA repressor n=1 Tax=Alienimonas chondri TaxID=2681879 RepID=A0ABX1VBW5_9PLAN|nr:transcriptional repressor LexA [Alienimonas chondri]NNJ25600.1 LexA repressor [Alienimonas chondri]